jgi:DNA-binding MarR family transcriptional regulator
MVDALEARGLVERRPTLGKWVAAHPTEAGRAASAKVLDARGERLTTLVGAALARISARCFGITDFISALLARRVHSAAVALVAQLGGTAMILVGALLIALAG